MLSEIHCKKIMNRKEPATKRIRKRASHKAYTEKSRPQSVYGKEPATKRIRKAIKDTLEA